jgi:hypothetical protein
MNMQNILGHAVDLLLVEAQTATSTVTGTGVDVTQWEGLARAILNSGAASVGTLPTLNVKLQHCATVSGTYADITGAVFTEVTDAAALLEAITVNVSDLHGFVRALGTIGGTATPTFAFSVTLSGFKKAS